MRGRRKYEVRQKIEGHSRGGKGIASAASGHSEVFAAGKEWPA